MRRVTARLTPRQRMLLRWLAREPAEDAVGLELDELDGCLLRTADSLVTRGLVEFYPGWNFTFWYRLTAKGRATVQTELV